MNLDRLLNNINFFYKIAAIDDEDQPKEKFSFINPEERSEIVSYIEDIYDNLMRIRPYYIDSSGNKKQLFEDSLDPVIDPESGNQIPFFEILLNSTKEILNFFINSLKVDKEDAYRLALKKIQQFEKNFIEKMYDESSEIISQEVLTAIVTRINFIKDILINKGNVDNIDDFYARKATDSEKSYLNDLKQDVDELSSIAVEKQEQNIFDQALEGTGINVNISLADQMQMAGVNSEKIIDKWKEMSQKCQSLSELFKDKNYKKSKQYEQFAIWADSLVKLLGEYKNIYTRLSNYKSKNEIANDLEIKRKRKEIDDVYKNYHTGMITRRRDDVKSMTYSPPNQPTTERQKQRDNIGREALALYKEIEEQEKYIGVAKLPKKLKQIFTEAQNGSENVESLAKRLNEAKAEFAQKATISRSSAGITSEMKGTVLEDVRNLKDHIADVLSKPHYYTEVFLEISKDLIERSTSKSYMELKKCIFDIVNKNAELKALKTQAGPIEIKEFESKEKAIKESLSFLTSKRRDLVKEISASGEALEELRRLFLTLREIQPFPSGIETKISKGAFRPIKIRNKEFGFDISLARQLFDDFVVLFGGGQSLLQRLIEAQKVFLNTEKFPSGEIINKLQPVVTKLRSVANKLIDESIENWTSQEIANTADFSNIIDKLSMMKQYVNTLKM